MPLFHHPPALLFCWLLSFPTTPATSLWANPWNATAGRCRKEDEGAGGCHVNLFDAVLLCCCLCCWTTTSVGGASTILWWSPVKLPGVASSCCGDGGFSRNVINTRRYVIALLFLNGVTIWRNHGTSPGSATRLHFFFILLTLILLLAVKPTI